jgi:hypothetical protein
MAKKVHRGQILSEAIYATRIPIVAIAELVQKSRRKIYNDFDDPDLSDDALLSYGKILGIDFSKWIPGIERSIARDPETEYKTQNKYQQKYFDLLEKHVLLIEELNALKAELKNSEAKPAGKPKTGPKKSSGPLKTKT